MTVGRTLRRCGLTLLLCGWLGVAADSAVAAPYPLGESSVSPAPGAVLEVPPKGLPVSFTMARPLQLVFALVEISPRNVLDPDGTLADAHRAGFGLLFGHGSGGLTYSGESLWTNRLPGTYYVQFSGEKSSLLSSGNQKCPGGESTCLYASQVYTVTIPEPPKPNTGWIGGHTRSKLSARRARALVRRAIRRQTGRKPTHLSYRCKRSSDAAFVCKSSWSDRKYDWAVRLTVKARGNHYLYSGRGRRASESCLKRASLRGCAVAVRWPTRRLR